MKTEASTVSLEAAADESPAAYSHSARVSHPQGAWEAIGPAGAWKIAIIVALFAVLYSGHLYRLYRFWLEPDWSHGFLVPVFCLYCVYTKRKELLSGEHRGSLWGLALMVFSFLMYVVSVYEKYGYPQPLSMIGMIAGIVLLTRGWRTLWLTAFPIGFLFLAIPPPDRLYREVTQPLQQIAAAIATQVLNLFPGVLSVERAGINIGYFMTGGRDGMFTVAGACSGMRSLMAFVSIRLMMAISPIVRHGIASHSQLS